jgi:hypothetical protein
MIFDAELNLIEGDDGGIYKRTSPQNNNGIVFNSWNTMKISLGDWFSLNGDLHLTEFHSTAYDYRRNIIAGGTQVLLFIFYIVLRWKYHNRRIHSGDIRSSWKNTVGWRWWHNCRGYHQKSFRILHIAFQLQSWMGRCTFRWWKFATVETIARLAFLMTILCFSALSSIESIQIGKYYLRILCDWAELIICMIE